MTSTKFEREIRAFVEAHTAPDRLRDGVADSVRDHRTLLAKMLQQGSRDSGAIDATVRGALSMRDWQDRLRA